MTALTIRNVSPVVKEKLRVRAARHGRSMEAELRSIVASAVENDRESEANLTEAIRRRIAPLGGVEFESNPSVIVSEPIRFDR